MGLLEKAKKANALKETNRIGKPFYKAPEDKKLAVDVPQDKIIGRDIIEAETGYRITTELEEENDKGTVKKKRRDAIPDLELKELMLQYLSRPKAEREKEFGSVYMFCRNHGISVPRYRKMLREKSFATELQDRLNDEMIEAAADVRFEHMRKVRDGDIGAIKLFAEKYENWSPKLKKVEPIKITFEVLGLDEEIKKNMEIESDGKEEEE